MRVVCNGARRLKSVGSWMGLGVPAWHRFTTQTHHTIIPTSSWIVSHQFNVDTIEISSTGRSKDTPLVPDEEK